MYLLDREPNRTTTIGSSELLSFHTIEFATFTQFCSLQLIVEVLSLQTMASILFEGRAVPTGFTPAMCIEATEYVIREYPSQLTRSEQHLIRSLIVLAKSGSMSKIRFRRVRVLLRVPVQSIRRPPFRHTWIFTTEGSCSVRTISHTKRRHFRR